MGKILYLCAFMQKWNHFFLLTTLIYNLGSPHHEMIIFFVPGEQL